MTDKFWKQWVREYLSTIQFRSKWIKAQDNVQIGDIVMVLDESTPRRNWPLGRIMNTFPANDGLVRTVEVKTSKNVYIRPIHKICILESAIKE